MFNNEGEFEKENYECWKCGKQVEISEGEPIERVFCPDCYRIYQEEHEKLIKKYSNLKIKVMYENAIRTMEKSKRLYMYEYLRSSKKIYEMAISETEKFMSSDEIIVAILLDEYGFVYNVNYQILNYRVDFYIPELKICLEVDGSLHQHKLEYDSERDINIRAALGQEWEVVRIPTKYIEDNPSKIIEGIEKLAEEKRRLRKKNGGYMPYGYSARENKHYDRILKNDKRKTNK